MRFQFLLPAAFYFSCALAAVTRQVGSARVEFEIAPDTFVQSDVPIGELLETGMHSERPRSLALTHR